MALDAVAGHAVHRLRGKADVRDDGDLRAGQGLDELRAALSAFDLDGLRSSFFDKPGGVADGLCGGGLVGAKGHVSDEEGALHAASDGAGVVQHLVHGDWKGGLVTEDGHADGVADEDDINTGLVDEPRCGVVVGGERGERVAGALDIEKILRRNARNTRSCFAVAELSKAHWLSPVPLRRSAADEARTC